jgi:hypothetical protein
LLPSLWMLWEAGGIPHLGYFHDDGIYAGTAATIAAGEGPKVESLPGEPCAVKYPPVAPLFFSLGFAAGERGLAAMAWGALALLVWQVWLWRRDAWMVGLVGWNVYAVIFASTTLSEVLATALLVWSVRWLEDGRVRGAAAAAGLAYLTRTALIALPVGAVVWLLWKRRWRAAAEFAGIFAVFFGAWAVFTRMHAAEGVTGPFTYYLSYGQFFRENMSLELLPVVMKTNFEAVVASLGGVLFFNGGDSFWEINFARLLLFAAVAGLWRKRTEASPYAFAAGPYLVLLTVWNFVPNERFLFPLLPLLLDGLLTELRHFAGMMRVTWGTHRGATVVIGGLVAAGVLWMGWRNASTAWTVPEQIAANYRAQAPAREKAYAWIRANTGEDANFLAYEEHVLRRRTGRHGVGIHAPTRLFYTNDTAGLIAYHDGLIRGMREWGLEYVLIGPNDLSQDLLAADREKVLRDWKTRGDLETVYEGEGYTVRRLRPLQSGM